MHCGVRKMRAVIANIAAMGNIMQKLANKAIVGMGC